MVLVAAAIDGVVGRLFRQGISPGDPSARKRSAIAVSVVVSILCGLLVHQAVRRRAFELRSMEQRFARAGRFVAERLPPDALVITDYESGSIPFYSGRRTLAWRALDPAWRAPVDRQEAFPATRRYESRESRRFPTNRAADLGPNRSQRVRATFKSVCRVTVRDRPPSRRLMQPPSIKSIRTLTDLMIAEGVSSGRHRPISRHLASC